MEVHLEPDVQGRLERLARTREMLDRRFDDLESGGVKPIDGQEAYRRAAVQARSSSVGLAGSIRATRCMTFFFCSAFSKL
jgi:hypothetical protein